MTFRLALNAVIAAAPEKPSQLFVCPHRVLWIDEASNVLILIGIEPAIKQPQAYSFSMVAELLETGQISIIDVRPRPFALTGTDAIPNRYIEMRDRAWEIIEPLVSDINIPAIFDEATRGRLIGLRAKALRTSAKQVRRPLFRYWAHGSSKAALIPFYDLCGPQGPLSERGQKPGTAKRGRRPDRVLISGRQEVTGLAVADVRESIVAGITEFYKDGVPRTKAWRDTKTKYFNSGFVQRGSLMVPIEAAPHQAPSYRQFCSQIDALDIDLTVTKRYVDTSTWNLKMRGVLGSSREHVFGPCARFEIDATLMDIYLVSVFNRSWIMSLQLTVDAQENQGKATVSRNIEKYLRVNKLA